MNSNWETSNSIDPWPLDGGLRAELAAEKGASAEDAELTVRDERDQAVLRYTDLFVRDAGGRSVPARLSLSGERLLIHVDDVGAVYPLEVDPLIWVYQTNLTASDTAAFDYAGRAVAIDGDTAIVGAAYNDDKGSGSGSAYIFVRSGGFWSQQAKFVPVDGATDDNFGYAVDVSGDTAVVGALYDDDKGADSGSAYVYVRSGAVWTQNAKLLPGDGSGDDFGYSLAFSGDTAVVGSPLYNAIFSSAGTAYVYRVALSNGSACAANQACATGFCVDGVCCCRRL